MYEDTKIIIKRLSRKIAINRQSTYNYFASGWFYCFSVLCSKQA